MDEDYAALLEEVVEATSVCAVLEELANICTAKAEETKLDETAEQRWIDAIAAIKIALFAILATLPEE